MFPAGPLIVVLHHEVIFGLGFLVYFAGWSTKETMPIYNTTVDIIEMSPVDFCNPVQALYQMSYYRIGRGNKTNRGCEYEIWNNTSKHDQCLPAKVMSMAC
ncbi:hypothetical protein N7537_004640 [Penicillium hordei]|uniref:Uncharacterized protein n=1 Tax=Penicillium hordei TaxID=40994 RepID=A0AAD6H526_9EURO|nr:uncharacterized protein N7537_004640 [Penicillium hordei]KAJ5608021.1 hypothetical protein N7537_004640 [Penicillium hordei]